MLRNLRYCVFNPRGVCKKKKRKDGDPLEHRKYFKFIFNFVMCNSLTDARPRGPTVSAHPKTLWYSRGGRPRDGLLCGMHWFWSLDVRRLVIHVEEFANILISFSPTLIPSKKGAIKTKTKNVHAKDKANFRSKTFCSKLCNFSKMNQKEQKKWGCSSLSEFLLFSANTWRH